MKKVKQGVEHEAIITTDDALFSDSLKQAIADDEALLHAIADDTARLNSDKEVFLSTVAELRLSDDDPVEKAFNTAEDLKRRALRIEFMKLARLDTKAKRIALLQKECNAYADLLMDIVRTREAEVEATYSTRNLTWAAITELIETDPEYAQAMDAARMWGGRGSVVLNTEQEKRERATITARIRAAVEV